MNKQPIITLLLALLRDLGGQMPLSGVCKGRATLCSGFSGQSHKSLGRAHNYESGACSYSGL